jgi:hydroxymethylbilane synthase
VASFAVIDSDSLTVTALVASDDGSRIIRDSVSGDKADARALGVEVAGRLLEQGAAELLTGGGE